VKVLVDACVWSLLLRRKSDAALSSEERRSVESLTEALQDGQVAIIGPIRQEVLSGVKERSQFDKLRDALRDIQDEPLTSLDYEEAARLFNFCRSQGVACGSTDILLCAVAKRTRWDLLTSDRGLERCIEVLKASGLLL
jgi:predicted nucleic acid-binding protein